MTYRKPARTTRRIPRILVASPLVVIAAIAAAHGYPLPTSSPSAAASPIDVATNARPSTPGSAPPRTGATPSGTISRTDSGLVGRLRSEHRALGEADGAVPHGTRVFDDEIPGVANLDPSLLKALRRAATDAAKDGVEFFVESGWRSPNYQEQLLREAISEYGSAKEAARWVATPTTSPHVSGDAVDIGRFDATAWLSKHGAKYGLCQIYRNEPWHYELRPRAIDRGCPPMYADPTQDPRMQQ